MPIQLSGSGSITGVSTLTSLASLDVSGNVSVGGTLVYDDVTNIDAVGLITARSGIHVTGGKVSVGSNNPSGNLNISYLQVGKGQVSSDHSLYNYNTSFTNNAYQNGNGTFAHITSRAVGVINLQDNVLTFSNGPGGTAGQSATLTERLRITSGGNTGIGTDNPGAKTHIDSTTSNTPLVVEASQNNRSRIVFRNNVETGTECNVELIDDDLRFVTNSGERLRITSDGNVGVNRPTPSAALDIESATDQTVLRLRNNGGDNTRLLFSNKAAGVAEIFYQGEFRFVDDENSDAERLRITSGGLLLVGSTSQSSAAAVQGFKAHGTTANESGVTSADTNSMAAGVGGEISFMGKTDGTANPYNYLGHIRGIKENGTNANTACALTFHTRPTLTAPLERLRITSDGKVGIRVTNPDLTLHVNGVNALPSSSGSTPTGHLTLRAKATSSSHGMFMGVSNASPWGSWIQAQDATNNATNYPLLLNPNGGNIGMGIVSPTQESGTGLHIRGANGGQTRIHLTNSDTGDTTTDGFYIISQGAESGSASGEVMLQQKENASLKFATNNIERLRITGAGRVRHQNSGGETIHELRRTDANTTGSVGTINFTASDSHSVGSISAVGDGDNEGAHLIFRTTSAAADNSPYNAATPERLRITSSGITQQRDLSGNYHVIASSRDGSTSARAATSAWEIKKTLGPDAKTGYYYLTNPYDSTTQQWWCDMETDGGGWILVAYNGDGQMASNPGNWYDRQHKGGFNGLTQGFYRGGGYWNTWGDLKGQLMWECRTLDTYFNSSSCSKVGINWGKTNNLPTAGTRAYGNITGNGNTLFENWCWDIYNAPGFEPSNYEQHARNNRIGGNNYFTEHMVITWSFRDTSGSADDGSSGPYWMIGAHHDGLHQHYEESLSGSDGVNGDGGYQVSSNEDTGWGGGGQQHSMNRLARHNQDGGSVFVWMR